MFHTAQRQSMKLLRDLLRLHLPDILKPFRKVLETAIEVEMRLH